MDKKVTSRNSWAVVNGTDIRWYETREEAEKHAEICARSRPNTIMTIVRLAGAVIGRLAKEPVVMECNRVDVEW